MPAYLPWTVLSSLPSDLLFQLVHLIYCLLISRRDLFKKSDHISLFKTTSMTLCIIQNKIKTPYSGLQGLASHAPISEHITSLVPLHCASATLVLNRPSSFLLHDCTWYLTCQECSPLCLYSLHGSANSSVNFFQIALLRVLILTDTIKKTKNKTGETLCPFSSSAFCFPQNCYHNCNCLTHFSVHVDCSSAPIGISSLRAGPWPPSSLSTMPDKGLIKCIVN